MSWLQRARVYGDSELAFTGWLHSPYPASWTREREPACKSGQSSVPFSTCYGTKGNGAYFRTAITGTTIDLSATPLLTTRTWLLQARILMILEGCCHPNAASLDLWEGGIRATGSASCPGKLIGTLSILKQGNWRYMTELKRRHNSGSARR
jgi:hypothetical protein